MLPPPNSSAPGAFARRLISRRPPSSYADAEWLLYLFEGQFAPVSVPNGVQLFHSCLTDAEDAILLAAERGVGLAAVWTLVDTDYDGDWLVSGVHPSGALGYLVTTRPWTHTERGWLPVRVEIDPT